MKARSDWKRAQAKEKIFHLLDVPEHSINKDWRDVRAKDALAIRSRLLRYESEPWNSKRVLEIGAGSLPHTAYWGGDLVFLEPSALDFIKALHQDMRELGIDWTRYVAGVGESLPFATSSVDIVVCHNVLDHCMGPATVLLEIHRVLRRGGLFYLGLNCYDQLGALALKLIRHLGLIEIEHPWHFTVEQIDLLLGKSSVAILERWVVSDWATRRSEIGARRNPLRRLRLYLHAVPIFWGWVCRVC